MRVRLAILALGALLTALHGARAEEAYPSRSIRLIVPYGAGGASDVMARYFGQKLTELWKANVVIENMAAAAGTIAYTTVARAPADGYTLVYGTSSIAVNAALRTKSPYDPVKDFRPISSLLAVQNVLVVPMSLPVKSVAELVALAKQKPGALNYVSLGPGSSPHLSMELFRSAAGITVQQVPYKLTTQAYTDLIDGRIQLWLASMPSALPFIQSGKIRALAVAGPTRSVALPDVPTLDRVRRAGGDDVLARAFLRRRVSRTRLQQSSTARCMTSSRSRRRRPGTSSSAPNSAPARRSSSATRCAGKWRSGPRSPSRSGFRAIECTCSHAQLYLRHHEVAAKRPSKRRRPGPCILRGEP